MKNHSLSLSRRVDLKFEMTKNPKAAGNNRTTFPDSTFLALQK